MRYMLLIHDREADWTVLSDKQRGEMYQEYAAFTDGIRKSGHYRAGDQLQPIATATTVRVKNDKAVPRTASGASGPEERSGRRLSESARPGL